MINSFECTNLVYEIIGIPIVQGTACLLKYTYDGNGDVWTMWCDDTKERGIYSRDRKFYTLPTQIEA